MQQNKTCTPTSPQRKTKQYERKITQIHMDEKIEVTNKDALPNVAV
jgi:hypothetical protein